MEEIVHEPSGQLFPAGMKMDPHAM